MFWRTFLQFLCLFLSWLNDDVRASADLGLKNCAINLDNGLINLKPLTNGPRLTTSFGKPGAIWNYSFNPCVPFTMPENPNEGFGDKCLSVSICKYAEQNQRMYYYTLGFQHQVEVKVHGDRNKKANVTLEYQAYSSLKGKETRVLLVCDRKRTKPEDAIFRIVKDLRGLDEVEAELYHICCCPGGCPEDGTKNRTVLQGVKRKDNKHTSTIISKAQDPFDSESEEIEEDNNNNNSSSSEEDPTNTLSVIEAKENGVTADGLMVIIIVGSFAAIVLFASVIGMMCRKGRHPEIYHKVPVLSIIEAKENGVTADGPMVIIIVSCFAAIVLAASIAGMVCYRKRTRSEISHKVPPGIRRTSETNVWQLSSLGDLMKGNKDSNMPMKRVSLTDVSETLLQSNSRASFRDYEKKPTNRKSLCFLPILENCLIAEDSLNLGQRLGGSIFGDTYIGEWTGLKVAIKRITLSVHEEQLSITNMKWLQDEVFYLSRQRHRNIVSVIGLCVESKLPYIIAEFITGQCLKDFIKNNSGSQLTWPYRVKILSQVADGMAFLHSTNPPILHRDLRCGNLFVTDNDVIKICDFGIVRMTQPIRSCCQKEDCCCQGRFSACSPYIAWTAPEILRHPNSLESDGYITKASDVYSFGMVMWELVMYDDPLEEMSTLQEVMQYVMAGGRPEFPDNQNVMPLYSELMETCWKNKPEERPNFKQVTVHLKELMHLAKAFQKALSNPVSNGRAHGLKHAHSTVSSSSSSTAT